MTLDQAIPFLAGVIGYPIVNFLKSKFNLSGKPAVWLTVAVSIVLAFLALLITGGFGGVEMLDAAAKVLATATVLYKLLPSPVANFGS